MNRIQNNQAVIECALRLSEAFGSDVWVVSNQFAFSHLDNQQTLNKVWYYVNNVPNVVISIFAIVKNIPVKIRFNADSYKLTGVFGKVSKDTIADVIAFLRGV